MVHYLLELLHLLSGQQCLHTVLIESRKSGLSTALTCLSILYFFICPFFAVLVFIPFLLFHVLLSYTCFFQCGNYILFQDLTGNNHLTVLKGFCQRSFNRFQLISLFLQHFYLFKKTDMKIRIISVSHIIPGNWKFQFFLPVTQHMCFYIHFFRRI